MIINFKKILAGALGATLIFSCISYAGEKAAYGFEHFAPQNTYTKDTFSDINAAWIHDAVGSAYELGLMSGRTKTVFAPQENVTLAEAISMACRIHDIYNGGDGTIKNVGSKWYDGAVIYAVDNEIIEAGQFTNFNKKATRAEMAEIFAHALPEGEYRSINDITSLPDVTSDTPGSSSIFRLYRAGIISGNDDYGTFRPSSEIKRSEAAVIVTRLAVPEQRRSVVLRPFSTTSESGTTYTAKSGRFTMTLPSDWKEPGKYSSAFNSLELESDSGLHRISVIEAEKTAADSLDSFSDAFVLGMKGKLSDASISDYDFTAVNGNEAMHCEITGRLQDVELHFYLIALQSSDRYFIVSGCVPEADAGEFKAAFDKAAATLRFL